MAKHVIRILIVLSLVTIGVVGTAAAVSAAPAFLCPVVGDGVINADGHNGDNGVSTIDPPGGTSQLPGKNKAGEHANPNAHNTLGPGNQSAGPGHNPDFSPIWPPS